MEAFSFFGQLKQTIERLSSGRYHLDLVQTETETETHKGTFLAFAFVTSFNLFNL